MNVGEMRVLPGVLARVENAKSYLHTVERHDLPAVKRLLSPEVRFTHANYPPVRGHDEVAAHFDAYRKVLDGVEFRVRTIIAAEDVVVAETVTVYTMKRGRIARIPQVFILGMGADDLIVEIGVYGDIADLFRDDKPPLDQGGP